MAGTEQKTASDYKMTVIKYDSSGTKLWTAHYDSAGYYDGAAALLLNPATGNVAVTGFSGTGFNAWDFATINFNANTGIKGTVTRSSNGNGGMSKPVDMTNDFNGNLYVLGTTALSPTNTDWKILKYDTLLNQVWVKTFGSADSLLDEPTGIAVDYLGQLIIAGYSVKTNGGADAAVIRMNLSGSLLWGKTLSAEDVTKQARFYDVTVGLDNNVYATGSIYNGADYDYLTVSYDINGTLRWQRSYNNADAGNDEARNVQVDGSGNVYISGVSRTATDTQYVTLLYKQDRAYVPIETDSPATAYAFYENRGQILVNDSTVADSVFYYTNAGNPQVYVGDKRLSYVLTASDSSGLIDSVVRVDMIVESSVGPYTEQDIYPYKSAGGYLNYFLGYLKEPVIHLQGTQRIVQKSIYRNIDWHLLGNSNGLQSEFVIQPNTDPGIIKVKYEGIDSLEIDDKKLLLHTRLGTIVVDTLIAYDDDGVGNRTAVGINYTKIGTYELGLVPGIYNSDHYLIVSQRAIDGERHSGQPEWSTYIGGNAYDEALDLTTDEDGNIYMVGKTASTNFPMAAGVLPLFGNNAGRFDAFISKFGSANGATLGFVPNANKLLWSTYWGGGADDEASAVATLGNGIAGEAFISGTTKSSNFTVYSNGSAYFQNNLSGTSDAFIIKIDNQSGGGLLSTRWASYFGGNGIEEEDAIVAQGNTVYIGGKTTTPLLSSDMCISPTDNGFPNCTTWSSYNNNGAFGGGTFDGYLARFSSIGNLEWSTFYGGSGDDGVRGLALNSSHELIVTGETSSSGSAVTLSGAYNQTNIGGGIDAFVSTFSSTGTQNWHTYFGGSGDDYGNCVVADQAGNIYIGGTTSSSTPVCSTCHCSVPATVGTFPLCKLGSSYLQDPGATGNGTYGGGASDGFLAEFNPSKTLIWSTYYGDSEEDKITDMSVDYQDKLYYVGTTSSPNPGGGSANNIIYLRPFPYYWQNALSGGSTAAEDAFVGHFDVDKSRYWASYFGGSEQENGNAMTIFSTGPYNTFWYIAGCTFSQNLYFYASNSVSQGECCPNTYILYNNQGGTDAFLSMFTPWDHLMSVYDSIKGDFPMRVFPNPVSGELHVRLTSELVENLQANFWDLTGRLIFTRRINTFNNEATFDLDLSALPPGPYILSVESAKSRWVKKIFIYE